MKIRRGITVKILFALLLLSGLTFFSMLLVNYVYNRTLSSFVHQSIDNFSEGAQTIGNRTLNELLHKELEILSVGFADRVSEKFKRVGAEFEIAVGVYRKQCLHSALKIKPGTDNVFIRYDAAPPKDIYAYSSWKMSGNVDMAKVQLKLQEFLPLHEIFQSVCLAHENIVSMAIAKPDSMIMIYPWERLPEAFDPRSRGWYRKAVANPGKTVWSGPYVSASSGKPIFSCSQAVLTADGKLHAVVGADLNLSNVIKYLVDTDFLPDAQVFLLNKDGLVLGQRGLLKDKQVLRWDKTIERQSIFDSKYPPSIRKIAGKMIRGEQGVDIFDMNNERYYMAYAPIQYLDWSYAIVLPLDKVLAPVYSSRARISDQASQTIAALNEYEKYNGRIILLIGFILAILIIVLGCKFAGHLTSPIVKLRQQAEIIGQGDFDTPVILKTGDELEELADTVNKMTGDLKKYIHNLEVTTAAKEKIEQELTVAKSIQQSMLPRTFPPFPDRSELDVYAIMDAAREVGGDFYDYFFLDHDKLYFAIGDVSGKGVPAALFMALCKTLLGHAAQEGNPSEKVLMNVNKALEKDNELCMFATVFCAVLDLENGKISFSNGGHNPPLVYSKKDGCFRYLELQSGFVIGAFALEENVYASEQINLSPGDIIVLYSDGVTEALNPDQQLYGEERLLEFLNSIAGKEDLQQMLKALRDDVEKFAGGEAQSDDITLLSIEYRGNSKN